MSRRCFDHFVVELSVTVGSLVPRYALWLRVQELGDDPTAWGTPELLRFFDAHLDDYLRESELSLGAGPRKRLRRRLQRYDPAVPTPYETMERIFGSAS